MLVKVSETVSLWRIRKDEDESLSLEELVSTDSGRWTVALEVVATVFMLPFMYIGAHLPPVSFLQWVRFSFACKQGLLT